MNEFPYYVKIIRAVVSAAPALLLLQHFGGWTGWIVAIAVAAAIALAFDMAADRVTTRRTTR